MKNQKQNLKDLLNFERIDRGLLSEKDKKTLSEALTALKARGNSFCITIFIRSEIC
ncbi:hypothetical protein [Bacillus sp. V3-13]|uniref:hypothetical protein n=1 Tax=Bacillus sp. V3-13 TaxID=2053728 RepID=UPI0015E0A67F|nr:hypothetical protein [Bacillus sp. V3-13]